MTSFQDDRIHSAKFSPKQLGCQVKEGELLGWIIDSPHSEISVLVHEDAVRRLDLGMPAKVRWDAAAGVEYRARIKHISRETVAKTPAEILGDPRFISIRNDKGELVPEAPHYEVRLVIDSASTNENHAAVPYVLPGSIASVRFETHTSTLLELILEYVRQNLRPIY